MTGSPHYSFNDILNSDETPSLPEVALRIIEVAQQPDPDPIELVQIIRADPATAGRIMKFANSALFGLRHKAPSIEGAVPMLGTTLVRTLVLGFFLAKQRPASRSLDPWFRQLWRESLFQASAAEAIAEKTAGADPPTWFLAGLLQEIGQIAMLNVVGQHYVDSVLDLDSDVSRLEREVSEFGYSHVDVGVALCQKWNIEPQLISAISNHHITVKTEDSNSRTSLTTALVTAAACCEYIEGIGRRLDTARLDVERLMVEKYHFLPDEIPRLLADFDARSVELACGFSIDLGNVPSRETLLENAQDALRQIATESRLQILRGMATKSRSAKTPADSDWIDESTPAFNRRYLDDALPMDLQESHSDGASVGLLEVDFSDVEQNDSNTLSDDQFIALITGCVRPEDCVIRTADKTAVVVLKRLNFDLLNRIGQRIQDELNQRLDIDPTDEFGSTIAGVVVVPAGRKAAAATQVLKTLQESANTARQLNSNRIAFQILTGKKSQRVEAFAATH